MAAIYNIPAADMNRLLMNALERRRRERFEALVAWNEWYCFHDCKKECQSRPVRFLLWDERIPEKTEPPPQNLT